VSHYPFFPRQDLLEPGTRTGEVALEDFDRGVVVTLGGEVNSAGTAYVIKNVPGTSAPPDFDGIPIYFAFPDEVLEDLILPCWVVRRDSITPAMSRWHQGMRPYRIPAPGATTVEVTHPVTGEVTATGFSHYEESVQAVPFDLLYNIQIRARYRNNLRVPAMKMLTFTLKRYQPYTQVEVMDTMDKRRTYDAFMETPAAQDTQTNVADREIRFNVTLRVEAELDLNDPYTQRALGENPTINMQTI
jgi:hypothetical protein